MSIITRIFPFVSWLKTSNPDTLKDGYTRLPDGEEIFYISNPALGLWALKSQF